MDLIRSTHLWFGLPGKCRKFNIYIIYIPIFTERLRNSRAPMLKMFHRPPHAVRQYQLRLYRPRFVCAFEFGFFCAKNYCYKFERLHLMIYKHKSKYARRLHTIYLYSVLFANVPRMRCLTFLLFFFSVSVVFFRLVRRMIAYCLLPSSLAQTHLFCSCGFPTRHIFYLFLFFCLVFESSNPHSCRALCILSRCTSSNAALYSCIYDDTMNFIVAHHFYIYWPPTIPNHYVHSIFLSQKWNILRTRSGCLFGMYADMCECGRQLP